MDGIFFSIIIPAYNAEKCIERSIESVLAQKYENYELIIVNDGSEDKTAGVLEKYICNKVKTINQMNTGVSGARNAGIMEARGEYICFLDADDIYYDNHLDTLKNMIQAYPEEQFFITGYQNILLSGKITDIYADYLDGEYHREINFYETMLRYNNYYNTNCMCVKKTVFDEIGCFESGVSHGEDTDMWYRIGAYHCVVVCREITNARHRDYSVATKQRCFNYNWIFEKRVPKILSDESVPIERKHSLKRIMEDRKIVYARQKLLEGKKREAYKHFCQVDKQLVKKRRLYITAAAFLLPTKLLLKYVDIRDEGYYQR